MIRYRSTAAQVLCQCVRPSPNPERLRALSERIRDWDDLAAWAEHLRIGPMVEATLRDAELLSTVPERARAALQRQTEHSRWAWNRQMERFGELIDALAARGVVPILLKGAALVATVYDAPELRTMSDIDLLTNREELEIVEKVLYELGFDPGNWCSDPAWFVEHHHHLVPFMSNDEKLTVEVHHALMPAGSFDVPTAGLIERAQPVELFDRRLRTLTPADLLLHVCVHLAVEFSRGLRSLADIARIVEGRATELDWPHLVESARACDGHRHVRAALLVTRDLLGTPIPADALDGLAGAGERSLVEDALGSWLVPRTVLHHPDHDPLPDWLLERWCDTLLTPGPPWRRAGRATMQLAEGYVDSIRQRAEERGHPVWTTILTHPAWLVMRRLGLRD